MDPRPYIIRSMRLQQSNNKPLSARLIVSRNFIKNIGHDNGTFRRQKSEERMRFASSRRRQTRATYFLRNVRDTKDGRLSQGDVSTHKSAVQLIAHYGQSEMTSELLSSVTCSTSYKKRSSILLRMRNV